MAQINQGIKIFLDKASTSMAKEEFDKLLKELKSKAEKPITVDFNDAKLKKGIEKTSLDINDLITKYKELGTVTVDNKIFNTQTKELDGFRIKILDTDKVLTELKYKASSGVDGAKVNYNLQEKRGSIKETDQSSKYAIQEAKDLQKIAIQEEKNHKLKMENIEKEKIARTKQSIETFKEKLFPVQDNQDDRLKKEQAYDNLMQKLLKERDIKEKKQIEDNSNKRIEEEKKVSNTWEKLLKDKELAEKSSNQKIADDRLKKEQAYDNLMQKLLKDKESQEIKSQQDLANKMADMNQKSQLNKKTQLEKDALSQAQAINKTIEKDANNKIKANVGTSVGGKFNYGAETNEIKKYAQSIIGVGAEVTKIVPKTNALGNEVKEISVRTKEGATSWRNYKLILDSSNGSMRQIDEGMSKVTQSTGGLGGAFQKAIGYMSAFAGAGAIVYGTINKLKEGIGLITELDKIQTNIQMIAPDTVKDSGGIGAMTDEFASTATKLHTTTSEIMKGSEELLRAGKSMGDTKQMLEASVVGGKISGQTTEQVSEQMIAISNGFKLAGKDAMGLVDTLSAVDNASSTSFSELADAMKRTSSSAQMAGVDVKQLTTYVGTVSSVTRKSAESIGESFKFGRLVA